MLLSLQSVCAQNIFKAKIIDGDCGETLIGATAILQGSNKGAMSVQSRRGVREPSEHRIWKWLPPYFAAAPSVLIAFPLPLMKKRIHKLIRLKLLQIINGLPHPNVFHRNGKL